ncbi:hypothetical protein [Rhizobium leguminosarum]|nr:hypothetical protein [Rhizobium leguminosarum]
MNEAPFFRNGIASSIKECAVFQDRISPTHRTIPGIIREADPLP